MWQQMQAAPGLGKCGQGDGGGGLEAAEAAKAYPCTFFVHQASSVKIKAVVGVMLPQTKDLRLLPELKEYRKDPPLKASEKAQISRHLDFRFISPRSVKK